MLCARPFPSRCGEGTACPDATCLERLGDVLGHPVQQVVQARGVHICATHSGSTCIGLGDGLQRKHRVGNGCVAAQAAGCLPGMDRSTCPSAPQVIPARFPRQRPCRPAALLRPPASYSRVAPQGQFLSCSSSARAASCWHPHGQRTELKVHPCVVDGKLSLDGDQVEQVDVSLRGTPQTGRITGRAR